MKRYIKSSTYTSSKQDMASFAERVISKLDTPDSCEWDYDVYPLPETLNLIYGIDFQLYYENADDYQLSLNLDENSGVNSEFSLVLELNFSGISAMDVNDRDNVESYFDNLVNTLNQNVYALESRDSIKELAEKNETMSTSFSFGWTPHKSKLNINYRK